MLKRQYRLSKRQDFSRAYRSRLSSYNPYFSAKAVANNLDNSRIAVVVSTKVSKRAVVRNRIRRRLAELAHCLWEQVEPGYDIVLIVKQDIADLTPDTLAATTQNTLKALGILRQS